MHPTNELIPILKKLRMSGVFESLDLRVRQAADENLPPTEFLYRLLHDEVERREGKQLEQRLRRASFEHRKTLEDFDFTFNPLVPKSKVLDLLTCAFIVKRENICLVGKTGVGKSHIAQAIGHRACIAGYTVFYISAHRLLTELRASRADDSYERRMVRLTKPDLLIVDDLGLRALKGDEPMDLYEVIRRRYERASMILTSNRDISELPPLFMDPLPAGAAMDRLLHHCHVLVLEGHSYRNPPTKGRRKSKAKA